MNSEEFIKAIKLVVHDSIISNFIYHIEHPTGRKPHKSIVDLSEYVSNLSERDKAMLQKIIAHATHQAIFGFLTVLDGVVAIENFPERGELKLYWEKDTDRILLNNTDGEFLHDIYQAEVQSEIFGDET